MMKWFSMVQSRSSSFSELAQIVREKMVTFADRYAGIYHDLALDMLKINCSDKSGPLVS